MSVSCTKDFQITVESTLTLLSYWKFDEASGLRTDSHGSNNLGLAGAPPPNVDSQVGIISNGTKFNLTTQAQLDKNGPAPSNLWDYPSGITMAGWLYIGAAINLCSTGFFTLPHSNAGFVLSPSVAPAGELRLLARETSPFQELEVQIGGFPVATWFFVRCWADPSDNKIHIRINEGATSSSASAFTPFDTGTCSLLRFARPCNLFVGADMGHDEWGLWRGVMTDVQGAYLYNSGAGRTYPDVPGI